MISRREFLQAAVAASAALAPASRSLAALAAGQSIRQSDLLDFADYGNVTLVHITDIHAQTRPVYFREPSINIGVGDANGLPPHITGRDFLTAFNLTPGSPAAYALASEDFVALATQYGRMGGLDRVATVINHIRASRDANMLLLDGGDTWQGSYVSHQTGGQDMVDIMNALKPDAMTAHWEFTFGEERVQEIVDSLPFAFLGSNIFDTARHSPTSRWPTRTTCSRPTPSASARACCKPTSTPRATPVPSSWCCCRTTVSTSTANSPAG